MDKYVQQMLNDKIHPKSISEMCKENPVKYPDGYIGEVVLYPHTGNSFKDLKNRLKALCIDLRFNTLKHTAEVCFTRFKELKLPEYEAVANLENGKEWVALHDLVMCRIQELLMLHTGYYKSTKDEFLLVTPKVPDLNLISRVESLASKTWSCNTFYDWVESLYYKHQNKLVDDKNPKALAITTFKNVLNSCFNFRSEKDAEAAFLGICGAMVACLKRQEPEGFKWDIATILQGEPGIGKTSFWENLFEPGSGFFAGNVQLTKDHKQLMDRMIGYPMVELTELETITHYMINPIKSFLSNQVDVHREPYAKKSKYIQRRTVFVGTTNNKKCIPDDEGLKRRTNVLEVLAKLENPMESGRHVINTMKKTGREILWACVFSLSKTDFMAENEYKISQIAKQNAEKYIDIDEQNIEKVQEKIRALLDDTAPDAMGRKMFKRSVLEEVLDGKGLRRYEKTAVIQKACEREGVISIRTESGRYIGKKAEKSSKVPF